MRRIRRICLALLVVGPCLATSLTAQEALSSTGSVVVTPDGASTNQPSTYSGLQYVFNVHNSSGQSDSFFMSCTRTGAVSSCSASPSLVTVPAGDNASVTVTYATGNPGSGRFTLRAFSDETGLVDTGWVNVTVATPAAFPTVSLAPYNGSVKDLGKCVAACFDQVMTFATPAYFSLGSARSFGLTYSSAGAAPTPAIEVDVTPPSVGTVTRYEMELRRASDNTLLTLLNGQTSVSYAPRGGTNRLAAALSAVTNGLATGALDIRVTVKAHLASGGPNETTVTASLVVVDRRVSNYGVGVWPSGVQQHMSTALGPLLIESDGSYFLFRGGARPGGTTSSFANNRRTYLDGSYVDFDAVSGMMLRAVDVFSNTTTYHWTGARLDSITDPMGHRMRMAYNPGTGLISSVSYPASRTTSFQHDGSSRLTRVTDPDARYTQLGYTGNLVISQTTRSSVTWDYTYDGLNRLATAQAPSIPLHDGSSGRPSGTLVSHLRVVWQPSIAGTTGTPKAAVNPDTVRATLTDPLGVATRYKVDRFMAALLVEEPLARVTTITRDTMARATQVVTPSGHDTRYTWGDGINPPSEPVSKLLLWKEEDVTRGRTSTFKYTTDNRVKEVTGAGLDQRFTYHASGALKARYIGGSSNATDSMVYDARGRMIVRIYGDSLRRDSTWYDATWGNLEKTKNARGLITRYHFDNAGRTDSVYAPDHATQAYGSTTYGVLNEVATTRNALGHVTSYVYNDDGTLQSVTDPKSQVYHFGYNALGALVAQKDLANPAIADSVFYDLAGQARRVKTRRGSVVQNTYDVLGRLTQQRGTLGADTALRQFSYDSVGRRIVGWNNEARDTLFLDPMGRVTSSITRLASGPVWKFSHTYDALDRRTLRSLSRDGSGQAYGGALAVFDGFGSQTTLREGGVNVEFHPDERVAATDPANVHPGGHRSRQLVDGDGVRHTATDAGARQLLRGGIEQSFGRPGGARLARSTGGQLLR